MCKKESGQQSDKYVGKEPVPKPDKYVGKEPVPKPDKYVGKEPVPKPDKRRNFKFEKWNKNIGYVANYRHNFCSTLNINSR